MIASGLAAEDALDFTVKLETVIKHDDGKFLWFHPRAAAIPASGQTEPTVVITIQKHLKVSDYYSGLHVMMRANLDAPWTGPVLPPELDWQQLTNGVTISVADVTPGWHAPSGKLLAIGCQPQAEFVPPPPPRVSIAQPVTTEIADAMEFVGNTRATATVDLRARVNGYLKQILFKDGAPAATKVGAEPKSRIQAWLEGALQSAAA